MSRFDRPPVLARLGLLGLLSLSSCRLTEADLTPLPELGTPERWSAGSPGEQQASDDPALRGGPWWEHFGDPELNALVSEALLHNQDLMASAARVQGALAQARIAGAALWPSLDAGLGASRSKQVFVGLPIPGSDGVLSNYVSSYGVSLDLAWELDLWGRLEAQEGAATETLVASAADHHAAQLSLAAQTCKAWFAWQAALLQVELTRASLQSLERSSAIVERNYASGRAPSLDVQRTRGNLSASRAQLETRLETQQRAQRQLEILVGRYPSGALERSAKLPALRPTPEVGIPSELLQRRPDLIAAAARLRAADYGLYEARSLLYPRLSLSASAGRSAASASDLLDSDFNTFSLAANLLQPIFQAGRLREGVELADARTREIAAGYAAEVLRAFSEVEVALAVEDEIATRQAHLEDSSRSFQRALELARDRYASGLSDLTTLLDSERRALQAESDTIGARIAGLENRINLHLALGGGLEALEESK